MLAKPQKEHQWLEQLLGEWTYEHESSMGPGQPVQTFRGTETFRSIGGLWVVGESHGEMPGGGAATSIMTLGFDPQKGRFLGTWIGSMMTHLWIYEATLDAAGKVLPLASTGPNFADGGKTSAQYQDVITFIDNDHRTLTARMQGEDGAWTTFMTAHYYRKK